MKLMERLALCAGFTMLSAVAAAQPTPARTGAVELRATPAQTGRVELRAPPPQTGEIEIAPSSNVVTSATVQVPVEAPTVPPRFGRAVEHSLGLRTWAWNTPAWMVGLFAHVANDWSGPMTAAPALEYVYRKGALDLVVGLQYTSLSTTPGFLRGRDENDVALERVQSNLWTLSANVLFLWTSRINDWFEIQYGMGAGVSYVGGNLNRTQVYPNAAEPGGYAECNAPSNPRGDYCDSSNNHYRNADGTRYAEPRLGSGGSVPPAVPWLSIPHVALHFRPHRHIDLRVDGGWAVIGFYGGLAAHYVF